MGTLDAGRAGFAVKEDGTIVRPSGEIKVNVSWLLYVITTLLVVFLTVPITLMEGLGHILYVMICISLCMLVLFVVGLILKAKKKVSWPIFILICLCLIGSTSLTIEAFTTDLYSGGWGYREGYLKDSDNYIEYRISSSRSDDVSGIMDKLRKFGLKSGLEVSDPIWHPNQDGWIIFRYVEWELYVMLILCGLFPIYYLIVLLVKMIYKDKDVHKDYEKVANEKELAK